MSSLAIGSLSRARYRIGAFLAIASIVVLGSSVASHAVGTSFEVPEEGLSFDAVNTNLDNACEFGFGNAVAGPSSSNEVSFLRSGDALTFKNVATIQGQVIDAKVTVVSLDGTALPRRISLPEGTTFPVDVTIVDPGTLANPLTLVANSPLPANRRVQTGTSLDAGTVLPAGSVADGTTTLPAGTILADGRFETAGPIPLAILEQLDVCVALQPRLLEIVLRNTTPPGDAFVVIEIDFLLGGTSTRATLNNLKMNVEDVDNDQYLEAGGFTSFRLVDGRSSQNVQPYTGGPQTLKTSDDRDITFTVQGSATRFFATGNSSSSDPVSEKEKHVVELTYDTVSAPLTFRLGAYSTGSASFDLDFRGFTFQSDLVTSVAPSSPSTPGKPQTQIVSPAIMLDVKGNIGAPVSASSALIEGQGLQRSSAYTLRLGPGGQMLKTGTVSRDGTFAHTISLPPGLSPGRYFVELSAVGADGGVLVLKQFFTVGSNGVLLSIETAMPAKASLANTGVGDTTLLLAYGSLGLLFAGLSFVASARRPEKASP